MATNGPNVPGYFLTTFEENDVDSLQEVLNIESINNNLIKVPKPYTLEDAKFWVNSLQGSQKHLLPIPTIPERTAAFFSQENPFPLQAIRYNGRFIGCISLTPRTTEPVVELGYYIHPAHSGKKVMQAAGRKLLQYAVTDFGIRTVYSSADVMNPASARVIESLSRETARGEVVKKIKILSWPVEKKVEGREVESPSQTWMWSI